MTELDFTADEWFNITGRGWVATFKDGEQLPKGMIPSDLVSRYIRIDGHEYWCTGADMFRSLNYYRSQSFGLLVRGPKKS